jgi:hypothetical protein
VSFDRTDLSVPSPLYSIRKITRTKTSESQVFFKFRLNRLFGDWNKKVVDQDFFQIFQRECQRGFKTGNWLECFQEKGCFWIWKFFVFSNEFFERTEVSV